MNTPSMQSDLPAAANRRGTGNAHAGLAAIAFLYCVASCIGITWGLPSRKIDKFLFGDGEVWTGEKIHRLARAGEKFSPDQRSTTGADVDRDPLFRNPTGTERVEHAGGRLLTGSEEDVAKIYLRYRLYTYQPDEMITMMALAGMRPREWQFDPRLYQYGGLFIYPVGALIKLCGILGLIDVRNDLVYYLDNPDEFGKFYIIARAYSAAWGLAGIFIVFAITRRLAVVIQTPTAGDGPYTSMNDPRTASSNHTPGLIAALIFALMPVVICMAHEGKPHLPGAVLMLLAVYLCIRAISHGNGRFFWLMCLTCGAAVGMVLSSWPICVLIPLAAVIQFQSSKTEDRSGSTFIGRTILGTLAAIAVYFATNPYVPINFFANREVLRSNFGNSLAMYEIDRIGEGLLRVFELTVEGATLPVVVLGFIALAAAIIRFRRVPQVWLVILPAALFFAQFVLIGAGKPAEYGRFGIFTNTVLAIGAAALPSGRWLARIWGLRVLVPLLLLVWTGYFGLDYLRDFHKDSSGKGSRVVLAREIHDGQYERKQQLEIALPAEPAPYLCPPLNFSARRVWLFPGLESIPNLPHPVLFLRPLDDSISWADKTLLTTWQSGSN